MKYLLKYQKHIRSGISNLYSEASKNIVKLESQEAWEYAIEDSKLYLNFNDEDFNIIKTLGKMLGKTDVEGQVSEIDIALGFIDMQINKAEEECKKNEKMYKSLGTIMGLAIVIILF